MKVSVNIKMEQEIRDTAKALFNKMGLDMTTAVNLFLIQSIRQSSIPFEIKVDNESIKSKEGKISDRT